jgi:hypothetical protein
MTMYRGEFDHYNTFNLEDRILSASEVAGLSLDVLKDRVKLLVRKASERLKNIQLAVTEKIGLLTLANEGIKALKVGSDIVAVNTKSRSNPSVKTLANQEKMFRVALTKFYLDIYPNVITQSSGKNLSMTDYYDYTPDPTSSVSVQTQAIAETLQTNSDFISDVPVREFDSEEANDHMGGFTLPEVITNNKEFILMGLGAIAIGALGYHIFTTKKK